MVAAGLTGVLAWAACALGQSGDAELERLEQNYLRQRDVLVRPLLTSYADQLRQLRSSLVARRDARVSAVDEELQRVTRLLAVYPLPLAGLKSEDHAFSSTVTEEGGARQFSLLPSRARLVGGAMYDTVDTPAIHFSSLNQISEWMLPMLRPGRWQLRILVSCLPGADATARLTFSGLSPITVRIEPTGKDGEWLTLNLGEIEFTHSPAGLKVELVETPASGGRSRPVGRFALAEVILTPLFTE